MSKCKTEYKTKIKWYSMVAKHTANQEGAYSATDCTWFTELNWLWNNVIHSSTSFMSVWLAGSERKLLLQETGLTQGIFRFWIMQHFSCDYFSQCLPQHVLDAYIVQETVRFLNKVSKKGKILFKIKFVLLTWRYWPTSLKFMTCRYQYHFIVAVGD